MLNEILHRGMGESDWSVEPTLVDEHGIHTSTCFCGKCNPEIYETHLSVEEYLEWSAEDETEQARRRAARYESPGLRAWRAKNFPPKELAG